MKKLASWDMSSFMWTHLSVGVDKENGFKVLHNDKEVQVNSAWYGYDNCMTRMIDLVNKYKLQPLDCILVFEGLQSKSKRLLINKEYKGGGGPSRPPEAYAEFEKLREMLKQTWKELGAQVMWQDFAEGDDTLGWLAENTEVDMQVFTFDNDLTVLNKTNRHGAKITTWINQMEAFNKYGIFDYPLVTTYKALVGDSSDNIRGCSGFGPAAWDKLLGQYGEDGVQEIHAMLENSNLTPLAECINGPKDKLLQKIFDQAPEVINSFDLAKLRPQWVNTMREPLHWEPGMVRQWREGDDVRLKQWYGQTRLVTAANFDSITEWAMPRILQSPFVTLDIETSTPDESDDWLALQSRTGDAEDAGVDSYGSTLTGLSLTFGRNSQFTVYFSVDHADTDNVDSEQLRQFIAAIPQSIEIVIHNMAFELGVLFNAWGAKQMDNGWHGFLPNVRDTLFEASYVDENIPRGLKERTHGALGYRQQTFRETTELTAHPDELFPGGRVLSVQYQYRQVGTGKFEPLTEEELAAGLEPVELMKTEPALDEAGEPVVATETRRYKMRELPAWHVLGYGADDTICTAALHNYFKLHMQLEHHYHVYEQVELGAAYMHAKSFIDGCTISLEKLRELSREDDAVYDAAWATLREYLMEKGWPGTRPPSYRVDISPAEVKEAFEIVTGRPLDTQMRTLSKLVTFAREEAGERQFAEMLDLLVKAAPLKVRAELEPDEITNSDAPFGPAVVQPAQVVEAEKAFTDYVRGYFKGEPQFNDGSPKQMQKLMYEVMGLPIRVRNKPTDIMRRAGIREGTPKTDALAVAYALQECGPEEKQALEALKLMGMVGTRRSLFYSKYPYFPHWTDGRVRSNHKQASTNTRRAAESKPNKQQLPKHPKIEGYASRFREVIVPHRPDAVIVSIDFKAQELRIIADYSRDPVMLSMYIGDNKRDQHTLTGLAIAQREMSEYAWTYEGFAKVLDTENHDHFKFAKKCRTLGKKLNFTAEYGAMAPKVAMTLMIPEDDAQAYLDARENMFEVAQQWKQDVIKEAKEKGYVRTKMGAVRHLAPMLTSSDKWIAAKAERQAVNFKVQSSSAEQTKMAEGRMWERDLFYRFDAIYIGPIHDELVASVRICDLYEFLPEMHACMVAPYADMVVPIEGDISFGLDFFNQIEVGPVPSREAIDDGLARMWAGKEKRDIALREAA